MLRETLENRKYVSIEFEPETKTLCMIWEGIIMPEEFKDAALKSLKFFYEKDAVNWLIDHTRRQAVHTSINEWVIEQFYPLLIDAAKPESKMAVVVSKDVFGRFATKTQAEGLSSKYKDRMLPYEYFKNQQEALVWIGNKEERG